jgi:CRP/FNR family transcriptional regulator, cyclic AMP receptor protein
MNVLGLFRNEPNVTEIAAGEPLFRHGEPGHDMFVVLDGEVDVRRGDRVIEVVGTGGLVGELALIDDGPRSADAIARTAVRATAVSRERFEFLVRQTPFFALHVMRVLAERVRRTTDRL